VKRNPTSMVHDMVRDGRISASDGAALLEMRRSLRGRVAGRRLKRRLLWPLTATARGIVRLWRGVFS
jgi:hypothetical protein